MASNSAYRPYEPAKRPGGKPGAAPKYRVLVHRNYAHHYTELVQRVGLQQAQQFWDHVSRSPGKTDPIAQTTILRGRAGRPKEPGWSKTVHYEVSSSARIDYQYCDAYQTEPNGDLHAVVFILTINYTSH